MEALKGSPNSLRYCNNSKSCLYENILTIYNALLLQKVPPKDLMFHGTQSNGKEKIIFGTEDKLLTLNCTVTSGIPRGTLVISYKGVRDIGYII